MESFWQDMARGAASEFSDLVDVEQVAQLVVRLLLAVLLGGVLGLERELHGKAAGVRTHMLLALGAALFVLVPQQSGMEAAELSRVMQGVIAGVGFLCAGTILKISGDHAAVSEEHVKGLTTAAGLWLTAAIGITVGLGRGMTAALSTLLAVGILSLEVPLRRLLENARRRRKAPVPDQHPGPPAP
jgi:putative Mg2+ transporter-C (MgtC) family protein